jgi:hypothetical protein
MLLPRHEESVNRPARGRPAAVAIFSLAVAACSGGLPKSAEFLPDTAAVRDAVPSGSVAKAYEFLRLMMDKYATGSTRRFVRSYANGKLKTLPDAFSYDDALFIDAMLAATPDGIARAKVVGDAFLYVQAHDPAGDGRVRAAYGPKPLKTPRDIKVDESASDVGDNAWVGQALVQLYAKTSDAAYLKGALEIATWIQENTYDTRGSGGYTGGYTSGGEKIKWKSTEHNIDTYALFTMLATESGERRWISRASWAKRFVASMWNQRAGRFYVGTLDDGVTPNRPFKPEDVNSWSYLAFHNPAWAAAPSWDVTRLAVSKNGFSGVSFCSGDRSGVWFEGTAHLADALELRNQSGDESQAQTYLDDLKFAQTNGLNADGLGIIAASINGLSDCDGDKYFASLHVGATAWYIMSTGGANPFVILP